MSSTHITPSERRRSQQRDKVRRTILDSTEALLVEEGFDGFSMRLLAARCGYTAPTIYHHFGDKQGLLDAVVEERFRLVLERIRGVRRRRDPAETLRAILLELARFGVDNPTHHRLLSMKRGATASEPASAVKARQALEEPLADLARKGRLAVRDVEQAALFLWVVLHGFVSLRIDRTDADWPGDAAMLCVASALRGLLLQTAGALPRSARSAAS